MNYICVHTRYHRHMGTLLSTYANFMFDKAKVVTISQAT